MLWNYSKSLVLWENSLFFEVWKGAISHTEAMELSLSERAKYLGIAKKWVKKRNKDVKNASEA